MAVVNPLFRQAGAVAPTQMLPGTDTINPALLPSSPTQQTFVVTLASAAVGNCLSKDPSGVWSVATNANKLLVIGIVIAKTGNDCTVAPLGQLVTFPAAHGFTADATLWLGTETIVTAEPSTPAGGKKVVIGMVINNTTILAQPIYVEEA
jgi:hypothetical protein